ncbi:acyl-CoA synthetase [Bradyrhizobium sp. U87765 SZCCT0131]|uniref:acyl-CoA synthetase n=1 Tax=unclassified Bradyrhizobium TaxID=2631580 RepID=UPI001BAB8B1B|nr:MULTISPECIES: acyl-CoA synthetase [unclassified Bradyrhizobium]MBR1222728.1 acyl-CoA synthetase [Bradyrhizobium sp. U87765 SZCCT0131]MBR1265191.1 acyl-CoA synthetase [Bradyrhizobium sp. U87765 SZCCT0134]MBR1303030.1 acyl-CoA synthetase [Bradyrhizobium sp. U87765 SZCCT0110]MBR1323728.1 acyl-CoA synthetase [Bradyrhizobium sp. U87765 SZCCT0109]MBR1346959.1 acyl-CoA synthetase [Bradyrhizobium sp. U87765 SZCCT0048]
MTGGQAGPEILRRNSIADATRRAAAKFRDRVALTFADRQWTFHALEQAAGRVAHRLMALGLHKGDRVAAYARNSDAYLLLWLACNRSGLVHVPINYALTAGELKYILRQSGARVLVYDGGLVDTVAAVRPEVDVACYGRFASAGDGEFDVLAIAGDATAPRLDETDVDDNDLAQLLYTSGTTAAPKGAMMTHRALLAEYASCIVDLEFRGTDIALAALPLYHSAQMHCFSMPQLLMGATTHLIEAPAPDLVLKLIEQHRITSFFAPPTVWISLLRHADFDKRDLSSLRNVYYGASIMPVPVLQELRQRLPGIGVYNCYGQSEIGPLATVLRPEEHDARPASAGRPILNVETRIVDPEMRDVPPGTQGEIVHRSPQLLMGYWDKPEETREAFEGGWFHSGDVGYMDEGGFIFVVDRVKDIIKTGGVVVAGREVEEALFKHPSVSEVAVIGLPDPKWIEAVTAVVVLRPGHAPDEAGLLAHAREHLAPFKVPKQVFFTETLPRNTAGKLLKRELRVSYADKG